MTRLSDAYARFCDLLTLAEEHFASGNFPAAVGLAQIAARYAFPCHIGLFGSPRLERLLLELGKQIPSGSVCHTRRHSKDSRNILHILTYARPIGGDSRFVWRWMQQDCNNRHSAAITAQADIERQFGIPEVLREAAVNSGGFLWALSAPSSKPLEQAHELRLLCQEMDIVALHLFPYDIVPVLALAADCDSVKTIFVNHSDHTLWIGASVADTIAHLRRQSPQFLMGRRGLNPDQSSILPIPLVRAPSTVTSVQAKRALGYGPDVVLLLTIATPFKYRSLGSISFLDLIIPVLVQFPQAILIAVGPNLVGDWQSASIQTDGRIVPLGTRWDNDLLYAAADVYLDSFPFTSITSLLEAGSHGVPLLAYDPPNPELWLLGPGAPGLENVMELASDAESYRLLLTRLISDAEFRCRSGQRVQKKILSLHTGINWIHAVNEVYGRLEQSAAQKCLLGKNDTFDDGALDLAVGQLYSHITINLRNEIRTYIGALPYRFRLPVLWRLHLKGFEFYFLNLLPQPVEALIRSFARWARRVVRRILQLR